MKKFSYQSYSITLEGYPIWYFSWKIFSKLIIRIKTGYSFTEVQRDEYLNKIAEIVSSLFFFYRKVKIKYLYPFFNKNLVFYANMKLSKPNKKTLNNL